MTLVALGVICLFAIDMLVASQRLIGHHHFINKEAVRRALVFHFAEAAGAIYLWSESQLAGRGFILAFFLVTRFYYSFEAIRLYGRVFHYST